MTFDCWLLLILEASWRLLSWGFLKEFIKNLGKSNKKNDNFHEIEKHLNEIHKVIHIIHDRPSIVGATKAKW